MLLLKRGRGKTVEKKGNAPTTHSVTLTVTFLVRPKLTLGTVDVCSIVPGEEEKYDRLQGRRARNVEDF